MPNRYFKESLLSSQSVAMLSLGAQAFLTRLILVADDYGRHDARPALLRSLCFPLQVEQISLEQVSGWLQEMQQARPRPEDPPLIQVYETDGKEYLYFPHWARHNPPRAKSSKYPAPDGSAPAPAQQLPLVQPAPAPEAQPEAQPEALGEHREAKASSSNQGESLAELIVLYDQTFGRPPKVVAGQLQEIAGRYPAEWFRPAFEAAAAHGAKGWTYVLTILEDWDKNGFQADCRGKSHKPKRTGKYDHLIQR